MTNKIPTFDQLMNPLLRALQALGGSGSIEEIYEKVVEQEKLPEDVLTRQHDPEKSNQTEVGYRLAWARTYLKKAGLLENSSRGIWALTSKSQQLETLNAQEVVRAVKALGRKEGESKDAEISVQNEVAQEEAWKQKLHNIVRPE